MSRNKEIRMDDLYAPVSYGGGGNSSSRGSSSGGSKPRSSVPKWRGGTRNNFDFNNNGSVLDEAAIGLGVASVAFAPISAPVSLGLGVAGTGLGIWDYSR